MILSLYEIKLKEEESKYKKEKMIEKV